MRVLIAPDSFKESMTAKEVCAAIAAGIAQVSPKVQTTQIPLSDGGEGILTTLIEATNGHYHAVTVQDPLGRPVKARFGMLKDGETAVVEMAEASGLQRLAPAERNPLITTSYGTGELIRHAAERGAKTIIIGLGGSATNDGGMGMLTALGARFIDANGEMVQQGGRHLADIATIDFSAATAFLSGLRLVAACDVTNPLLGDEGATFVFSRQKGATDDARLVLEQAMTHYAEKVNTLFGIDITRIAGGGAAGGLGAALAGLCRAEIQKGIALVFRYTALETHIQASDLVITGEGSVDYQTQFGKTPYGVAMLAKKYKKPVICVAGFLGDGYEALYDCGITAMFSITNGIMDRETALRNGQTGLTATVGNLFRLMESVL